MADTHPRTHERRILGTELLWAFGVGILVAATISMIAFTALTRNINPPSNVERIDPKTLHLSGEFAEQNLGTRVAADGSVTARIIATQFMFVPHCVAVPQGRLVTLRFASPRPSDHGDECEYYGRARFRCAGPHAVYPNRRPPDAVPRILRPRPQRNVGDRAGASGQSN
jgi:hypothetical protein